MSLRTFTPVNIGVLVVVGRTYQSRNSESPRTLEQAALGLLQDHGIGHWVGVAIVVIRLAGSIVEVHDESEGRDTRRGRDRRLDGEELGLLAPG
jgi:hypothetical protein